VQRLSPQWKFEGEEFLWLNCGFENWFQRWRRLAGRRRSSQAVIGSDYVVRSTLHYQTTHIAPRSGKSNTAKDFVITKGFGKIRDEL
jgi:hypothetical protein